MSPSLIPLENWLGYFKETTDQTSGKTAYKFISSECFTVTNLGVLKTFNGFDSNQVMANIFGTELVLGVNNVLNTDISLWPEGICEDFSNVIYYHDPEDDQYKYQVIINSDDIEGGMEIKAINPTGVEEVVSQFAFTIIPKFNTFLNNEKDVFMEVITKSEIGNSLSQNLAAVGKSRDGAPEFKLLKLDVEATPDLHKFFTKTELSDLMKVGICRYINKCFPDLIHEDMVSKLKHFSLMEKPDGTLEFGTSFEIFGFLYLITTDYFPDYDFNPVDEDSSEG